VWLVIGVKS